MCLVDRTNLVDDITLVDDISLVVNIISVDNNSSFDKISSVEYNLNYFKPPEYNIKRLYKWGVPPLIGGGGGV